VIDSKLYVWLADTDKGIRNSDKTPPRWKSRQEVDADADMKTATCTHCGKPIQFVDGEWHHTKPEPGLRSQFCRSINVATPQRGTMTKT